MRISNLIRASLESRSTWQSEEHRFAHNMELALEGLDLQRQQEEITSVLDKLGQMTTGIESINNVIDNTSNPDASLVVMCRMQLQDVRDVFGLESYSYSTESVGDPVSELMSISIEAKSFGSKIWDALVWVYNKFKAFLKWINPWSKKTADKTKDNLKDIKEDIEEVVQEAKESPETVEITPAAATRVAEAKNNVQVLEKSSKKLEKVNDKLKNIEKVINDPELTKLAAGIKKAIATKQTTDTIDLGKEYKEVVEKKTEVLKNDDVTIDELREDLRSIAKSAEAEGANPGTPIRTVAGNEIKFVINDLKEIISKESTLVGMQKQAVDMLSSVDRIRAQIDGKMKDIESFMNVGPQDAYSSSAINTQIGMHRKLINEVNQLTGILRDIIDTTDKTVSKAASGIPKGKGRRRRRR